MAISEDLRVALLAARAFEAARNGTATPRFIGELCEAFGAELGFVGTHDFAAGTCDLLMHTKPVPAALSDYARAWYRLDPWLASARFFHLPYSVWCGDEVVPEADLLRSDFYRSWLEGAGLRYWLGGTIARQGEKLTYVALLRSPTTGPFARVDKLRLRRLLPHLEACRRLSVEPILVEMVSSVALDALEHVPFGVIALDRDAKVRYTSTSASKILKHNDGLFLHGESLRAASSDDSARLTDLISSVLEGRSQPEADSCRVLAISRPSGARPYVLNVFAHGPDLSPNASWALAAMVFIHDLEADAGMDGEILQTLYQLTPSEAKLAGLLSLGRSVSDAAGELGVTVNTARTHLKHVYSKTDTSRQPELVRLLVSMLAIGSSMRRPLPDAPKDDQARPAQGRFVGVG